MPSLKNSGLNVISFLSIPTLLHTFSISYGGIVDFTVTTIFELSKLLISVIADSRNLVSTEFVSKLFGV